MKPGDSELVEKARFGDMTAFDQLVSRYERRVLSVASLHTRNPEDARDIHQEVFLRVYRSLPAFRGESAFSTWLYRIVTNVCLSLHRQSRRVEYIPLEAGEARQLTAEAAASAESPEDTVLAQEISRHVKNALSTLSAQQRLVFILRHYQGLKLGEIAGMMDCAEGTVKRYLHEAVRKLRVQLRDLFDTHGGERDEA